MLVTTTTSGLRKRKEPSDSSASQTKYLPKPLRPLVS